MCMYVCVCVCVCVCVKMTKTLTHVKIFMLQANTNHMLKSRQQHFKTIYKYTNLQNTAIKFQHKHGSVCLCVRVCVRVSFYQSTNL